MSNFKNDGSFLEQFLAGKGTDVATASAAAPQPMEATTADYYAAYGMNYPGMMYPGYTAAPGYGYPGMMANPYGAAPPRSAEQPSKSLWVGNLPPDATESDLRREFSMFGMIEHVKMLHHKNCCFINYSDIESSMKAFNNSQGKVIYGQVLKIGYGKPDSHQRQQNEQERQNPCKNLWVGNLSDRVDEEDLRQEFEPYGRVERVKVLPHKNCGFVNFSSIAEATRARNALTGKMFFERPLRINYGKDDRKDTASGPPFAYPPADEKLQDTITRTAQMVVRRDLNVEMFEAYVALKNSENENPSMAFLQGGPGSEYFRWKIHCIQNNIPDDQFVNRGDYRHARAPLSSEDRQAFSEILQALNGTKECIKSATNWISQHSYTISDVVSMIDMEINSNIDYDNKLFIFYVVNDVLGYCSQFRSDPRVLDPICQAFQEKMVSILRAVYANETPDRQDRVLKVLRLWATKMFYDENTIQNYEDQMKTDGPLPENNQEDGDDIPPWLKQQDHGAPPPWQPPPPPGPPSDKRPFYGEEPTSKKMRVDEN